MGPLDQEIQFDFVGFVPGAVDTSGTPPSGLFLVTYLGEGDEVERADGTDTLIVTPFLSTDYEILPMGVAVSLTGGSTP